MSKIKIKLKNPFCGTSYNLWLYLKVCADWTIYFGNSTDTLEFIIWSHTSCLSTTRPSSQVTMDLLEPLQNATDTKGLSPDKFSSSVMSGPLHSSVIFSVPGPISVTVRIYKLQVRNMKFYWTFVMQNISYTINTVVINMKYIIYFIIYIID